MLALQTLLFGLGATAQALALLGLLPCLLAPWVALLILPWRAIRSPWEGLLRLLYLAGMFVLAASWGLPRELLGAMGLHLGLMLHVHQGDPALGIQVGLRFIKGAKWALGLLLLSPLWLGRPLFRLWTYAVGLLGPILLIWMAWEVFMLLRRALPPNGPKALPAR